MEIKKEIKNDLMNRKEIVVEMESAKTPSYVEATKLIAEHFKTTEDCVMVEQIKGVFGRTKFAVKASIYTSKELKDDSYNRLTKKKKEKVAAK